MKTLKTMYAAAAFALAALAASASHAAGVEVLNEGFNNVSSLPGWVQVNNSTQPGTGWFQGNPGVFGSHMGGDNSYAAANFLGAQNGVGSINNWLLTPTLTLSGTTVLTFFTRAADPGFADLLQVRFSPGSGTATSGFTTIFETVGLTDYPTDWQQYSATLTNFDGTGRFAFRYLGDASALNYIGLDSVKVITAVPEPSTYLMLGLGLGLLALTRRKFAN